MLILESNEEVDFSNDTDRLEEISLDILAFYEYIQARKMKDSEYWERANSICYETVRFY